MEAIFSAANDMQPVKALKQHWTQNEFSYLQKPRPDFGLMLLTSGRIDFVTPSTVLHAIAGDIVFLPKGCHYAARFRLSLGSIDNYLINFDSLLLQCDTSQPCRLLENAPAVCTEHFQQFLEESYRGNCSSLRSKGLLYLLLDSIFHTVDKQSAPRLALIERAKWLLQNNTMPVREIARQCSISESGLRALFHTHVGLSPTQFRLHHRLTRAAFLLESTDMNIEEIADTLHFYDASSFCRMFQKFSGQTPRQYARSKKL